MWHNTIKITLLVAITLMCIVPYSAEARNCGNIKGNKLVTYGGLSCSEAKNVYKAFQAGHTPVGWTCGLSAGACDRDNKGFTFRFN